VNTSLFGGNQLAVTPQAEGLSIEQLHNPAFNEARRR
jgi:hypothetical protein